MGRPGPRDPAFGRARRTHIQVGARTSRLASRWLPGRRGSCFAAKRSGHLGCRQSRLAGGRARRLNRGNLSCSRDLPPARPRGGLARCWSAPSRRLRWARSCPRWPEPTRSHRRDADKDGLTNRFERRVSHTNPRRKDTDRDRLSDRYEVRRSHTNPRRKDTDRDGLSDRFEVRRSHTNPRRKDTDKDGMNDGAELHPVATRSSRNPARRSACHSARQVPQPGGGGTDSTPAPSPVGDCLASAECYPKPSNSGRGATGVPSGTTPGTGCTTRPASGATLTASWPGRRHDHHRRQRRDDPGLRFPGPGHTRRQRDAHDRVLQLRPRLRLPELRQLDHRLQLHGPPLRFGARAPTNHRVAGSNILIEEQPDRARCAPAPATTPTEFRATAAAQNIVIRHNTIDMHAQHLDLADLLRRQLPRR